MNGDRACEEICVLDREGKSNTKWLGGVKEFELSNV